MVIESIALITTDEHGVANMAGTKMKVRQIAIEKNVWGLTPEEIQQGHEHLSLAQMYAPLSYYYDHKSQIDEEIDRAKQELEMWRAQYPNLLTREQLQRWHQEG